MDPPESVTTDAVQVPRSILAGCVWRFFCKLLVAYALVCLLMMALESWLVYPVPTSTAWNPADPTIEEAWFHASDGTRLHGWFFAHPHPQCSILYCHGNAEDVSHNGWSMSQLSDTLQASIFLFDYRGYGKSEGRPHESGLIQDGLAAQTWLAKRMALQPKEIVLWGRSLGGGVAVAIAERQGARALVLQNTFHDMSEVAVSKFPWLPVRWMMRNRFPSIERIKAYDGPVLQCHGTADRVVPFRMGKKLFAAIPSREKRFLEIPGGRHNDPSAESFLTLLKKFLSETNSTP